MSVNDYSRMALVWSDNFMLFVRKYSNATSLVACIGVYLMMFFSLFCCETLLDAA